MSIQYENGGIKFSIIEKNTKYHLDFYKPDGKRVRKSTKKDVSKENLRYIKLQLIPDIVLALGQQPTSSNKQKEPTLDEYAQKLFDQETHRISKATLRNQKRYYNNHIYPYFSERLISTIGHIDLKDWQHLKMTQTNSTGKRYRRSTVEMWRSILNKILDSAVHDALLEKNHFKKIPNPKSLKYVEEEQKEKQINPFTKEELKQILSSNFKDPQVKNFILLMYATGMRPGEIVALEWSDIDWNREVIHVTKTRQDGKDGKPKTPSSIREVEIFTNAKNALQAQLELTKDKEKIFVNKRRKPMTNHQNISYAFNGILKELEIEGKYLYALRHTFASTLISMAEIDLLWVSKMMGHKDLSVTLEKYAKFIKQDDETRLEKKRIIDNKIDIL